MRKNLFLLMLLTALGLIVHGNLKAAQNAAHLQPTPVPLPDGSSGIGFDDLAYAHN
jgi:hypothetical protein